MTVTEKMKEVYKLLHNLDPREVASKLGLNEGTVRRYDRAYRQEENAKPDNMAKVLLFDIETTPMEVYAWHLYPKYIHIGQIIKDWNIICWRAKWLFDDTTFGSCQTPEEAVERDDKRVTEELWNAINEADILIAHNLRDFDIKKANTKFLQHDMLPPAPYQVIDTLKSARKHFKFSSNKLDYLCQKLGIGAKIDTGFELWKEVLKGNENALIAINEYCGRDVEILEDLYLKLRPYIKSHPNMALYLEGKENKCTNCGSDKLSYASKPYYTPTGVYQAFRCEDCGAILRSRQTIHKRDKELLRSTAR